MNRETVSPQVIGPYVPWPNVAEDGDGSAAQPMSFNPARGLRGPTDHQADCQAICEQAR